MFSNGAHTYAPWPWTTKFLISGVKIIVEGTVSQFFKFLLLTSSKDIYFHNSGFCPKNPIFLTSSLHSGNHGKIWNSVINPPKSCWEDKVQVSSKSITVWSHTPCLKETAKEQISNPGNGGWKLCTHCCCSFIANLFTPHPGDLGHHLGMKAVCIETGYWWPVRNGKTLKYT